MKVTLKLPFLEVEGNWEPDERERNAAWELYIELITRTTVVELAPEDGLLREALSSTYSLFDTTRKLLRSYGPSVAIPKAGQTISFGYLALAVMNIVLRPLLAKWHPLLLDYESQRNQMISSVEHERGWNRSPELRQDLNEVRRILLEYANILAEVAGVPLLTFEKPN